jgi:hypothetical protein
LLFIDAVDSHCRKMGKEVIEIRLTIFCLKMAVAEMKQSVWLPAELEAVLILLYAL